MRNGRRRITAALVGALMLAPFSAAVAAAPAGAAERPLPDGSYGLSSYYGPRCMPIRGSSTWHLGQDMGASSGTDISAVARGTVVKAGATPGFGQVVVLRHTVDDLRVFSVYGHVIDGDRFVQVGDTVREGQKIADVGSSGTSTSPHLHLEIWRREYKGSGWTKDPLTWMRNHGAALESAAAWRRARVVPSSCTYYTTAKVNLRSGPGTNYRVIKEVRVNRLMTAKPGDGSGEWRRVNRAGVVGWMHANYVSPTLTSLGSVYSEVNGLRLRSRASTSAPVRDTLSRGERMAKIWPSSNGWTKVYVGGRTGFVYSRYLTSTRP